MSLSIDRRAACPPRRRDPEWAIRSRLRGCKIRILAVEDDPQIASLLTLELGPSRLRPARNGGTAAEALTLARTWAPSLVLLDLGLPDRDGAEMLRELRARGDELPVICLTARDQRIDRIGGLRAGADDYIVKPFDLGELDARIRAVLRRSDRADRRSWYWGRCGFAPTRRACWPTMMPLALTPRELHVLRRLLKNAGRVVTKAQLTETLSALNEDIGDKTVEVYVHRIRHKIQGYGVEIVTVRGFGYLLRQLPVSVGGRVQTTVEPAPTPFVAARACRCWSCSPSTAPSRSGRCATTPNDVYDRWLYDSAHSLARQVRLSGERRR